MLAIIAVIVWLARIDHGSTIGLTEPRPLEPMRPVDVVHRPDLYPEGAVT